ncbi:hypothetical protein DSO57_1026000 [Entomophthora muscae]|uniref:Uncharacterized protein n=1 Tax=Entomophthora muscae TaxID=34485 RepID=A0ACC2S3X1_9FUNG|nr:hypothetical protein DSO57_1026000 [Entomophthora muscae]
MIRSAKISSTIKTAREYLQANRFNHIKPIVDQGLREANACRSTEDGLELMEIAYQAGIIADQRQVIKLKSIIPASHPQRLVLARLIRVEGYLSPAPSLLSFVFKNYHTSLRNSAAYTKILHNAVSGANTDIAPLNILIEGLAKQGDVKGVGAVVETMKKAGIEPNNKTFGTLMEAYSRGRHSDKVISIWHSNPNKTPDNCQNQISILLDSCGFNSSLDILKCEWASIKRNTYILNENIYASYIQALIRQNDPQTAIAVFLNEYCKLFRVVSTDKAPKLISNVLQKSDLSFVDCKDKASLMSALSLPL